jgi:hypothetical protein
MNINIIILLSIGLHYLGMSMTKKRTLYLASYLTYTTNVNVRNSRILIEVLSSILALCPLFILIFVGITSK